MVFFKKAGVCLVVLAISLAAIFAYARRPSGRPLQISALPPFCESMGVYDILKCTSEPQVARHGCFETIPPPEYWGGLRPYLPMLVCAKKDWHDSIRQDGCKVKKGLVYLVLIQGKEVKAITNRDEFRRLFAPIDSLEEALSYVSAVTGTYPVYDFPEKYFIMGPDEGGSYTVKNPRPTNVKEKEDGFTINLFDNQRCGCFRPALIEVSYFVSRDGAVKELGRQKVWEANRRYNVCID